MIIDRNESTAGDTCRKLATKALVSKYSTVLTRRPQGVLSLNCQLGESVTPYHCKCCDNLAPQELPERGCNLKYYLR